MNLIEKINWYLTNFLEDNFNNYTNDDWIKLESSLIEMINSTNDTKMLQQCLTNDINYIIPYDVRLTLHKKLTELEPSNIKAVKDYAFYLRAFGDPPDEITAMEMLKRIKNK